MYAIDVVGDGEDSNGDVDDNISFLNSQLYCMEKIYYFFQEMLLEKIYLRRKNYHDKMFVQKYILYQIKNVIK